MKRLKDLKKKMKNWYQKIERYKEKMKTIENQVGGHQEIHQMQV